MVESADQEMEFTRPLFTGEGEGRAAIAAVSTSYFSGTGEEGGRPACPLRVLFFETDPCRIGGARRLAAGQTVTVGYEFWVACGGEANCTALTAALMLRRHSQPRSFMIAAFFSLQRCTAGRAIKRSV